MKNKIFGILGIIAIIIIAINNSGKGNLKKISDNDKNSLMKVLKIQKSSTFLPLEIKNVNSGFGDTTLMYILKFEISKEEYNANNLKYSDIDTTEISLNWKEEKDENTYICYVRENEYNEYRKELFDELKKLKTTYN